MNQSKEKILNKIAKVRTNRAAKQPSVPDFDNSVYRKDGLDVAEKFVRELENIKGEVFICKSLEELPLSIESFLQNRKLNQVHCFDEVISEQLSKTQISIIRSEENFETMEVNITGCEYLSARTGSVLVSSHSPSGRKFHPFTPIHLVIANESQLVEDLDEAFLLLENKYSTNWPSLVTTITGPSRTADIEKTLILGAHGPRELIVFLVKNH